MRRVTASEARRNWFRLLDEVAAGESVEIDRKGVRIVLARRPPEDVAREAVPDYRRLISAPGADEADGWSWDWEGPDGGLAPREGAGA